MKTPMQELIEQLEKEHKRFLEEDDVPNWFYKNGIKQAIKYAESMLDKEKEVMESAWQDGMYECDGDGTFEDFYKTFNTKEK
jgi:hypothetical protein